MPAPYRGVPTAKHNAWMDGDGGGMSDRLARAGVTDREAEVLWAVAERLRNREIAERLHLSVRTVESHIAALLRKLGATDRAALAETVVELRRTARTDGALPAPLTSLVGRETETAELVALLEAHRLVTLIGPAGVGKTRLALRVASVQSGRFAGGIRLADLAPVRPELVGDALARALGVVPEPGWSLRDILREAAAGMALLLLIDNCEHVVAEVAEIVADLLGAGRLRVLATSREPLGVPGEVTYPVPTLPVPTSATRRRRRRASVLTMPYACSSTGPRPRHPASRSPTPSPRPSRRCASGSTGYRWPSNSPRLGYAPSGRSSSWSTSTTASSCSSAGARTALPRHRTLRSAIDWSYELLDGDERALFDLLGVFPADFDYEAVQSVCQAEDLGGAAVLTLLPRLVDKSLVSTVGRGTRRYRLLETIRGYAADRLAASGAEPAARQRHAAHYLAVAEQAARQLETSDQRSWLDRLAAEQPNLRAALAHSVGAGDIDSAWRLIAALQPLLGCHRAAPRGARMDPANARRR